LPVDRTISGKGGLGRGSIKSRQRRKKESVPVVSLVGRILRTGFEGPDYSPVNKYSTSQSFPPPTGIPALDLWIKIPNRVGLELLGFYLRQLQYSEVFARNTRMQLRLHRVFMATCPLDRKFNFLPPSRALGKTLSRVFRVRMCDFRPPESLRQHWRFEMAFKSAAGPAET
jgi:hypothetical protein